MKLFNIKESLSQFFYRKYNNSFSQGGEDTILASLFANVANGFYIDIGAFHPYKFSNSFLFYRKGWNGINIDASPGSMVAFNKLRPRDINIEAAISETPEELTYYYQGPESTMNTFSTDYLTQYKVEDKVAQQLRITTQRLDGILEKHATGKEIHFMSIDVEGLELSVIRSSNWDKFRPWVVLLESYEHMDEENTYDVELKAHFATIGYRLICKTTTSILFMRNDLGFNQFNHIERKNR
jgi:FkbM family methyltransferase